MANLEIEDSTSVMTTLKHGHLNRMQEAIYALPLDRYLKFTKILIFCLFALSAGMLLNYILNINGNFGRAFNTQNLMMTGAKSMGEVMTS